MELAKFFQSIDILADLKKEALEFLAANSQLIEFPPAALIINTGEIGRFLWLVYEGEVEVTLPDDKGQEKVLALWKGVPFSARCRSSPVSRRQRT